MSRKPKPIRIFRPARYYEGTLGVIDVYPVGVYSDLRCLMMALHNWHWWEVSYRLRWIARSWRRRRAEARLREVSMSLSKGHGDE